ncbi:HPF/RaiA family ribosome-associated protein [Patescibacteria group bacterium]|nr:HPF/RaiA family ribosome-associated protein [Patescibacteria group bacterium]
MSNNIRVKNFQLSESLRVYVERKIFSQFKKMFRGQTDVINVDLDIDLGTRHHKKGNIWHGRIGVSGPHLSLMAEADSSTAQSVIDLLEEELKQELKKHKERVDSIAKRKTREIKKAIRLDKGARLYRKGRIRNEGV